MSDWWPNKNFSKKEFFMLIIIMIIAGIFWYFAVQKEGGLVPKEYQQKESISENINNSTNTSIIEGELLERKKTSIETEYTEFKDFELQDSFAGQFVTTYVDGYDHYFAYIVSGSGVRFVQATCFRVDHMMRVYKVGEFPDLLDSYAGYKEIDPRNCTGIK